MWSSAMTVAEWLGDQDQYHVLGAMVAMLGVLAMIAAWKAIAVGHSGREKPEVKTAALDLMQAAVRRDSPHAAIPTVPQRTQ